MEDNWHSMVTSSCCSVCSKTPHSLGKSQPESGHKESVAACQHQSCLFALQQQLIISRTDLTISRNGQQNRSCRDFVNTRLFGPKCCMGRVSFGDILNGIKPDATLESTSLHAAQALEGRPSLLQKRRRKKRRKKRSQSRASQAMKWPLKRGQNGPNGKPILGILIATSE